MGGGFQDSPQLLFLKQSTRRIIGIGDEENTRLLTQRSDDALKREFHFAAVAQHRNPGAVNLRVVAVHRKGGLANQDAAAGLDESIEEDAQRVVTAVSKQQFFRADTEVARDSLRWRPIFGLHRQSFVSEFSKPASHRW